jgi:2-oxo-hept-3-ene-1,7-dioate hydratase
LTLDDACAVQAALASLKKAQGARALGWKIGLTSRAMQQALNITIPDSGVLFDYILFNSGDSLCELSARDPG